VTRINTLSRFDASLGAGVGAQHSQPLKRLRSSSANKHNTVQVSKTARTYMRLAFHNPPLASDDVKRCSRSLGQCHQAVSWVAVYVHIAMGIGIWRSP
jgi:hypothetical protein